MLTKILLTILVAVIAITVARSRAVERVRANPQFGRALPPPRRSAWDRLLPAALVMLVVGIGVGYLYLEWIDAHEEVQVRVVNAQTGEVMTFLARKKDIHARSFKTLDGRIISLADVERLELAPAP
jgi:hypothetical protein